MTGRGIALGFLLLLLCSACGGRKSATARIPSSTKGKVQRGLASYYGHGDGYNGRITASGERFNADKLTAAHFSLPFGTRVEVKNLRNGRTVVVRINDRFPIETLRKGRIIDLSYGAARRLGMVRDGVVPVELKVLSSPAATRK